jgi:carbamate kinase
MENDGLTVVALGGNAISREGEEGNIEQQFANSRTTACHLADLIAGGERLVITHGNGPQIGNTLLRIAAAAKDVYPIPMHIAVADVQGGMGFMIAQTLNNELHRRGIDKFVSTIVTTVLVDANDQAFGNPTKPVGSFMTAEEVTRTDRDEKWQVKEIEPGKFRRVVASPQPLGIGEISAVRRLVEAGELVITCGGGGIPVVREPDGTLHGVRAVIDKDLASALLATELNASRMLIFTGVDHVVLNFRKSDEKAIEQMTVTQAEAWMAEGQFPPGSMGPKVQGAIDFLKSVDNPDAHVVIGPLDKAADVAAGRIGTRVTQG